MHYQILYIRPSAFNDELPARAKQPRTDYVNLVGRHVYCRIMRVVM